MKRMILQYDLDRKVAKISAFSSYNLGKYEYLTGEALSNKQNLSIFHWVRFFKVFKD